MSTLEEIKAATARLNVDEQAELFEWWLQSDAFRTRQLAALKRELAIGLEQLEDGHCTRYTEANVMELAQEVGRLGREKLKAGRKNPLT